MYSKRGKFSYDKIRLLGRKLNLPETLKIDRIKRHPALLILKYNFVRCNRMYGLIIITKINTLNISKKHLLLTRLLMLYVLDVSFSITTLMMSVNLRIYIIVSKCNSVREKIRFHFSKSLYWLTMGYLCPTYLRNFTKHFFITSNGYGMWMKP